MIFAALALGTWGIVAAAGCLVLHRARQVATPQPQPEPVNRPSYPPPVPVVRWEDYEPPAPSADWFDGIPADCLSDDAIRPLFDDIVRGEFA